MTLTNSAPALEPNQDRLTSGLFSCAVKALDGNRIGGYGVVFNRYDLEGDYHTADTDFMLDVYQDMKIPVFLEHTLPDMVGDNVRRAHIGYVKSMRKDDHGIYVTAQLNGTPEAQAVKEQIKQGNLYWSTGSIGHMAMTRRQPDGYLPVWPIVEISVTNNPAMPRYTRVDVLKNVYKSIGAEDALEALLLRAKQALVSNEDGQRYRSTANEDKNMEDKKNDAVDTAMPTMSNIEAKKMYVAFLDNVRTDIRDAAIKSYKQAEETGEDMAEAETNITEMLRPIAEQLAGFAGGNVDAALAMLVNYVAEQAKAELPSPEPEMAMDMDMEEDEEEMNYAAVSQAAAQRKGKPSVGVSMTGKSQSPVWITDNASRKSAPKHIKERGEPQTIGWMQAMRAKYLGDHATYTKARRLAFKSYVAAYGTDKTYKALGTTPDQLGGFVVPVEQDTQLIGNLYDESLFLSGNLASRRNMTRQTLEIPRGTEAISVGHIGENRERTANDTKFGLEVLRARVAYAEIRMSEEMLLDADPDMESWWNGEAAEALAEYVDLNVLRGDGTGEAPTGLLSRADVNKTALNAAVTYEDLVNLITRLNQSKIRRDGSWAWVCNPRDVATFQQLDDGAGNLIWSGGPTGVNIIDGAPSTLLGLPVYTTNQIDVDTDNNNETEIFGGRWSDVIVAVRQGIEFRFTDQRYWEYGQIGLRAQLRYDVGMYRDESIEILTDVRAVS